MISSNNSNNQVLVIGGGVAGISAALDLADQALELFLRDLCTRFGCDESTLNKKG